MKRKGPQISLVSVGNWGPVEGKDTVTALLKKQIPNLEQKSFAYKLKLICSILADTTIEDQFTQEGKNKINIFDITNGELQQAIGTEAMKHHFRSDVWITSLFSEYNETKSWVISDTRFKIEAQAIKDKGGFLIRVEGDPAGVRANSKRNTTHLSETDLDDWECWDFVIHNTGTMEDLQLQVQELINMICSEAE